MTNQYTPTTVTVADVYATANGLPEAPQRREWFYQWYDTQIQAAKVAAFRKAQEIIAGYEHTVEEARNRRGFDLISESGLIKDLDSEIEALQGKQP